MHENTNTDDNYKLVKDGRQQSTRVKRAAFLWLTRRSSYDLCYRGVRRSACVNDDAPVFQAYVNLGTGVEVCPRCTPWIYAEACSNNGMPRECVDSDLRRLRTRGERADYMPVSQHRSPRQQVLVCKLVSCTRITDTGKLFQLIFGNHEYYKQTR